MLDLCRTLFHSLDLHVCLNSTSFDTPVVKYFVSGKGRILYLAIGALL